jgi:AcrR family transcriptional regulator
LSPAAAKAPAGEGTRERILYAAAELFRRQGYSGTGIKQIAAAADAQLGSIYHFYPGGKEELAERVIETAGPFFAALVAATMEPAPSDPVAWVEAFFAGAAENVEASGYQDACPIATVALEVASTSERLRLATAGAFGDWIDAIAEWLRRLGVPEAELRPLATSLLAALEGGFVLARATRSTEPLEAAGRSMAAAMRAALAA